MWLRSTLHEQSQRTAMATAARCVFGSKMLGGGLRHGGALCSRRSASLPRTVRGQMHHIPLLRKTAPEHPRELLRTISCLQRAFGRARRTFPPNKERPCAKWSSPHYLPPERNGDCPLPHYPRCTATICIQQALLLPPLMGRWEEGFLWRRRYAPYASGSAASAASGCSSEKSVTPFSTSRSYHWMSFLISEICTRSRS